MIPILETILDEITGVLDKVDETGLKETLAYLKKEKRIFVDGEGRSGLMAKGFAMRLMHLGFSVYVIGETITPAIKKEDVFIVVSGSGESANSLEDTKKAKKTGSKIIAVTSKENSSIAELADSILLVPGTVKSEQGENRTSIQLLSSLFDQTLHITLDVLCLMISRRDGFSNEEATKKHW